jgi:hypothetical protein
MAAEPAPFEEEHANVRTILRWLVLPVSYVTAPIALLVSFEKVGRSPLRGGLIANLGRWTVVAVSRVERVVDTAMEVIGALKPRTGPDENAAVKPLLAVIPVGNAAVGGVVVVTIRTIRCDCDVHADLGFCFESGCRKKHSGNSS